MRALRTLVAVIFLAGCQAELFTGLTETDANQIVAALADAGIDARKVGSGSDISVTVPQDSFSLAVSTLDQLGLPKRKFDTIGRVFEKSGFVSTPMEERARYIYALSEEIGQTISDIDGVISARVHIVTPEKDALGNTEEESSASVFVKYDPIVEIMQYSPYIKQLASNAIPGLAFDNVSVIAVPAMVKEAGAATGLNGSTVNSTAAPQSARATEVRLLLIAGALFLLSVVGIALWFVWDRLPTSVTGPITSRFVRPRQPAE